MYSRVHAVEHVADINLGSILHFNRTAAEIKLSLSIDEKENKAILAIFCISIEQLLNSNNVSFLPSFTLSMAENENKAIFENATCARVHQIGLEFDQ